MPSDFVATNSPFDFGPVVVGSRKRDLLYWTNSLGASVWVGGVDPAASPDGAFKAVAPFAHGSIPGHDTAQTPIDFAPTEIGVYSAAFDLVLAPPKTCEGAVVQGQGVGYFEEGAFQLEELFFKINGLLDCGVVPVGAAGIGRFTLRNTSASDIQVRTQWETGQCFSLAPPLFSLPPGLIVSGGFTFDSPGEAIEVTFIPLAQGRALDVLTIQDLSGAPNTFKIAVQGIGVGFGDAGAFAAPAAGTGNTLAFGNVIVSHSRWSAFYLTNDTDTDIYFEARVLAGNQRFSIEAPNPRVGTIKAHDQLGFVIRFTPPAVGDFKDTLVIASPDGRHVVARHLIGTGTAPLHGEATTPSPGW